MHNHQRDYDKVRTNVIEQKGLRVIRFTNDEIKRDIRQVILRLISELDE